MNRADLCLACLLAVLISAGAAGAAGEPAAEATPTTAEEVAAAVNPALVRIHTVTVEYDAGREMKWEAIGSGVIFTREGHVVTNHHVAGNTKQIVCTLADKEEIDAELVGTDPLTDICVIKLRREPGREFPVARFGDSSRLKVGDRVFAMGSPLALSQSVTMGIVSNTELVLPDLFWPERIEVDGEDVGSIVRWIGHDASITSGNSGGPLVNAEGEVVGINELELGLGAAIPGNLARRVAEEIIERGKVTRAWLGVEVQPLLKGGGQKEGVLIAGTLPGSPAEKAGFKSGDLLLSIAGRKVTVSVPEELPVFNQMAAELAVGQQVEAEVLRKGRRLLLRVTPEERETIRPKDRELAQWGITARNLSLLAAKELRRENREGVLVETIRPGGPCSEAKPAIVERDILLEVDSTPVRSVEELVKLTERVTGGKEEPVPVVVSFDRRSERYLTVVKVGKEPLPQPGREVRKAWLPVATQVLTRELAEGLGLGERTGVRITQVYPKSSAERAGLKVGDFILALDGAAIPASRPEHFEVFPEMIRQYKVGAEAELTILRGGKEQKLTVTLEQSRRPPREMKKYRNDSFEFTARDIAFEDQVRYRWEEGERGALVEEVSEGGWAALGHLAVGDLVLEVEGKATPDLASLEERMKQVEAEKPKMVALHVKRGIHELYVELKPKW